MKSTAGQAYSSVSLMSVGWCARFSNCTRGRPPHGNRPNRRRPAHADQHPDWSSRWCFSGWTTTGHQPARNRKRCAEWLRSRIAAAVDHESGRRRAGARVQPRYEYRDGRGCGDRLPRSRSRLRRNAVGVGATGSGTDGRVTMSPVCLSGPADETRRDSESN